MKVLILGGTKFVGRHITESALKHGHEVTLFNRGQTNSGLFEGLEKLIGDRDGGLDALKGRRWDAVIDVNGYLPRVVRATAELLAESVDRYVFISSISVFAEMSQIGITEKSAKIQLDDPTTEEIAAHYGGLKALCERAVEDVFTGRSLIIRPGLVIGPHDHTYRFTYWLVRVAAGGEMLVPDTPDYPMQFIDARDLAEFTVSLTESKATGDYNATGPEHPITLEAILEICRQATGQNTHFTWVAPEFLEAHGVQMWQDLPLWVLGPDHAGMHRLDVSKALSAGLQLRPLVETVHDLLESLSMETLPNERAGLSREREREVLALWAAAQS